MIAKIINSKHQPQYSAPRKLKDLPDISSLQSTKKLYDLYKETSAKKLHQSFLNTAHIQAKRRVNSTSIKLIAHPISDFSPKAAAVHRVAAFGMKKEAGTVSRQSPAKASSSVSVSSPFAFTIVETALLKRNKNWENIKKGKIYAAALRTSDLEKRMSVKRLAKLRYRSAVRVKMESNNTTTYLDKTREILKRHANGAQLIYTLSDQIEKLREKKKAYAMAQRELKSNYLEDAQAD